MIHVSVTEAKTKLGRLIEESKESDVIIIKNSKPVAVLISFERFNQMAELLEDLEDSLAGVEALAESGEPIPLDQI